nr:MAG TPA: zinc finger domain protein [Bacteriophage sp.]DAH19777.1 MAG TPA: zinc finger domain protein [Caudoviricetes sp.]
MISLSLAYLQCVPCERRFSRTEPIKPLNDAYHDRSFIEGNHLGLPVFLVLIRGGLLLP